MSDEKFTKILVGLLSNANDLMHWGFDKELTTPEKLRLTVEARKQVVTKLHEEGLSQRQIAAAVGAARTTIQRDIAEAGGPNGPESGPNGPSQEPPPKREPREKKRPQIDPSTNLPNEPEFKPINKTVVELVGPVQACRMKVRNTVSAFLDETPKDKWLEMIAVAKADLDDLEIWAKREIDGNDGHLAPH